MEFRRLFLEQWESRRGIEFRLGIDDTAVIRARLKANRALFFDPTGKSGRHFTLLASPEARRLTFHESLECDELVDGHTVRWNLNGAPVFVLNAPHIEHRSQSERFQTAFKSLVAR